MSPYTAQLTLPRLGESKRYASFYDLQARSFRAEKLTQEVQSGDYQHVLATISEYFDTF